MYTFNFEGNSQVLDNFFVTDNVLGTADFDIVHVNVDFPASTTRSAAITSLCSDASS